MAWSKASFWFRSFISFSFAFLISLCSVRWKWSSDASALGNLFPCYPKTAPKLLSLVSIQPRLLLSRDTGGQVLFNKHLKSTSRCQNQWQQKFKNLQFLYPRSLHTKGERQVKGLLYYPDCELSATKHRGGTDWLPLWGGGFRQRKVPPDWEWCSWERKWHQSLWGIFQLLLVWVKYRKTHWQNPGQYYDPIHEHGMAFYLLKGLISFLCVIFSE